MCIRNVNDSLWMTIIFDALAAPAAAVAVALCSSDLCFSNISLPAPRAAS